MEKDLLIEVVELTTGADIKWNLLYYVKVLADGKAYGMKIERQGHDGILSESTGGLTRSYEQDVDWIRLLARGKVTPWTLHAVVDDLVG